LGFTGQIGHCNFFCNQKRLFNPDCKGKTMEKTHHNIKAEHNKKNLPGSIYARNGRYWWKVQLPGENKPIARPLKNIGAKFATTDRLAAIECAKTILQNHLFKKEIPVQGEIRTIPDLARAYMAFAKTCYVDPLGKPTHELVGIKYAIQPLLELFSSLPVEVFGINDSVPLQTNFNGLGFTALGFNNSFFCNQFN
jgi:hypothetical protein